jgi:hypothetical protein
MKPSRKGKKTAEVKDGFINKRDGSNFDGRVKLSDKKAPTATSMPTNPSAKANTPVASIDTAKFSKTLEALKKAQEGKVF